MPNYEGARENSAEALVMIVTFTDFGIAGPYLGEMRLAVPSDLVVNLIKKALIGYGNRRYLLDGFPRN